MPLENWVPGLNPFNDVLERTWTGKEGEGSKKIRD